MNRGAWIVLGVLFFVSTASAQMLGTSARQMTPGSLKLLAYYQGVQDQKVRFSVRGTGGCTTQNGLPFQCDQTGDLDAEGTGGMGIIKLVWQPWELLQYYGAFGAGDYKLRVPTANGESTLTGDNLGLSGTVGIRSTIYPDTIVTPGIALDASVSNTRFEFNRSMPMGGVQNKINQVLSLWQYQFAVETSKQFSIEQSVKLEPYGGLKWVRTNSDLLDRQDGSHAGGRLDTVTPFLGLRVPVLDHEAFFAEASFINGYQYAAGLELRFK